MSENLKITFIGGERNGESLSLPLAPGILAGRTHAAQIRFSEKYRDISGSHLRITLGERSTVWAESLSGSSATAIAGRPLAKGEKRQLKRGDEILLGAVAKFRIDDLETVADDAGGPSSVAEDAPSLTGATRYGEKTRATEYGELTQATRIASSTRTMTTAARAESTRATRLPDSVPAADPVTDQPTPTDTSLDAPTMDGYAPTIDGGYNPTIALDNPSTVAVSTNGGGQGRTIVPNGNWIDHVQAQDRIRRRVKISLLVMAVLLFVGVVGWIVYDQMPKDEILITQPKKPDGSYDRDHFTVQSGGRKVLELIFPHDPRQKVSPLNGNAGVDVESYTGKRRDVPFHLRVEQTVEAAELTRSLEESASVRMRDLSAKESLTFLSQNEVSSSMLFFESTHSGSCVGALLLRGTRYFESIYEVMRQGRTWRGVLYVFRDGVIVYTVRREIPSLDWPRGEDMLVNMDSNLGFYPDFQKRRWESPGKSAFVSCPSVDRMIADVSHDLELPDPVVSCPDLKRRLDTLMVKTWGDKDRSARVRSLLSKFRSQQDDLYRKFSNRFKIAKGDGDKTLDTKTCESVWKDARRIFSDPSDRRFESLNNPRYWSWQKKDKR